MARILLFLVASICCAYAEKPFHYFQHEYDRTPLGDSIDHASLKLLKEAYHADDDKNVISSPLGVLILLSLYATGATEPVKDEIVKFLGSSNFTELLQSYSELNQHYSKMDPDFLAFVNKLYVDKKYTIHRRFADTATRSYGSEVGVLDFSKPLDAVDEINRWAELITKGNIKKPVPEDAIDDQVAAALFNIISYKGRWSIPFNASNTVEEDFHVDKSTTVKKQTMRLTQSLFYYESKELGAKCVEIPDQRSGYRMVIILPDEIDGLPSVLEKAIEKGILPSVFSLSPAGVEIDLHLPKFNIESGLDLTSLLPKVGVSRMFTDGAPGIVTEREVAVSKVFQKAFISVDEQGATGGAFTGFVIVPMSLNAEEPEPIEFKVDHPFMFALLDQDKMLFVGTYSR